MFIVKRTEANLWTVGTYINGIENTASWLPHADFSSKEEAQLDADERNGFIGSNINERQKAQVKDFFKSLKRRAEIKCKNKEGELLQIEFDFLKFRSSAFLDAIAIFGSSKAYKFALKKAISFENYLKELQFSKLKKS